MKLRQTYLKEYEIPDGYYRNEISSAYYFLDRDKMSKIYISDDYCSFIWCRPQDIEEVIACTKEEFDKALSIVMNKSVIGRGRNKTFEVEIRETFTRIIEAEAETKEEALERVELMYREGEIVPNSGSDNLTEVKFNNV